MKQSIGNRIITYILITIAIAAGIVFCIRYHNQYLGRQKMYYDTLLSDNMHYSNNCTLLLTEFMLPERELVAISVQKLQNMNLDDDKKIQEFILDRGTGFTAVGGFYFGRSDGTQFTNSNIPLPTNFNPTKRPWYIEAAATKELITTRSYIDSLTGKECITIAAPVYQNNRLKGVVGLDIFTDKFYKLFQSLSPDHKTHYYITDIYGNIIVNDQFELNESNLTNEFKKLSGNMNITAFIEKQDWFSILSNLNGYINIGHSNNEKLLGYYWTMPAENWKVIEITDPKIYSSDMAQMKFTFYSYGIIGISFFLFIILIIISINMYIEKKRIKYMLTHDLLTDLPNGQYLDNFIKDEMNKTNDTLGYSLILMDIDNFKFINDTYGHNTGDEILRSITGILKSIAPEDGILIRSGGDEFAVLLINVTIESVKYFTERLQNSICSNPLQIGKQNLDISISTGYTVIDSKENIMKFFSLARAALKTAKEEGKNRVVCLLPENITSNIDDPEKINELISLIKNAIRENRFILFFQPIMEISSKKINHYEALIRLRGNDNQLITPGIFIPVAERFGLISDIDRWVFEEVLKIITKHPHATVFMNISGLSLTNNSLLEFFEKSILKSGIDPEHLNLGFEITETASSKNFIQAQSWMEKFRRLGCKFALDDFGVGYTSFTYLRTLPVDYIKIDGSFVHNIDKDSSHRAIVQTINTLAVSLGKNTIAEFVENEDVLRILKEIGIRYGQGYHLGKPEPINEKLK